MATSNDNVVLSVDDVHKSLAVGEVTVKALRGVSLSVSRGEFVGIVGPSGSGKSTLLGLIGGLDTPTSGKVSIDGTDITRLSERALTRVRNEKIGIVFQQFNLIPTLSALENVALPVQFSSKPAFDATVRATELLTRLGLGDRMHHRPSQLSGGQQQRVAIARALANNPPLLLADEPTGNLDSESTSIVMAALRDIQRDFRTTVIIVTHDTAIAASVDRLVTLIDGHIAEDTDPMASVQLESIRRVREKRATGEIPVVRFDPIQR